jgi:DNA-binding beta-propeller fold protein YncE
MKIRIHYWFLSAVLVGTGAIAATVTLDGPRLGMLFDPQTRALHPILGIPGSAVVGRALELGISVEKAAISPAQDFVLVTAGDRREVVMLRTGRAPIAPIAIEGADPAPNEMILSAGGRAAVLYHRDRNRLQVITGLPSGPRVSSQLYLSAGEAPSAFAVSDDGRVVLAGIGGSLKMITANGEVPVLPGIGKITAIAFGKRSVEPVVDEVRGDLHRASPGPAAPAPLGYVALAADALHDRLFLVRNVTGDVEAEVIGTSAEGIASPVALAVSRDNRRVFVANAKSGTVAIFDLLRGDRSHSLISCGCSPTGLDRLNGDVFRLTAPSSRPLWVLEADGREPRVVFVPADLPERNSSK